MTTRAERLEPMRAALAAREGSFLVLLAATGGIVAAVLHLIVAPAHFAEHLGQGLFMVGVAAIQILWALAFYRRVSVASYLAGLAIALGSILVWVVAITIRPPFQSAAEPADAIAYATEAAQALTVLALLFLPFSQRGAVRVGRALPIVVVALLLGVGLGGATYGAGLVGEDILPVLAEPAPGMAMDEHATDTAPMQMGPAANTTNATGNASASKDPNMPDDPSACMPGMDMPGCTAAQADYAYKKQQEAAAAAGPKPDMVLAPLKIRLDPQSAGQTASFSVESGVKKLLVTLKMSDSGSGPYFATGPNKNDDLAAAFKAPATTAVSKSITLTGTAATAGAAPAAPLSKGPWNDAITLPAAGSWTIELQGAGSGVVVEIDITERYTDA